MIMHGSASLRKREGRMKTIFTFTQLIGLDLNKDDRLPKCPQSRVYSSCELNLRTLRFKTIMKLYIYGSSSNVRLAFENGEWRL